MTKTIEFVEKEIEFLEKQIVKYEIHLFAFPQVNVENRLEEMKEDLQILEQIKCELEAWEIVKSSINLSENREDYKNRAYLNVINYSDKEWLILKKALEVE
jgi:hypothetical protein